MFLKQSLVYCLLGFGTESNEGNPDSGQAHLSLRASLTRASSSTSQNGVCVLVLPLVACGLAGSFCFAELQTPGGVDTRLDRTKGLTACPGPRY